MYDSILYAAQIILSPKSARRIYPSTYVKATTLWWKSIWSTSWILWQRNTAISSTWYTIYRIASLLLTSCHSTLIKDKNPMQLSTVYTNETWWHSLVFVPYWTAYTEIHLLSFWNISGRDLPITHCLQVMLQANKDVPWYHASILNYW